MGVSSKSPPLKKVSLIHKLRVNAIVTEKSVLNSQAMITMLPLLKKVSLIHKLRVNAIVTEESVLDSQVACQCHRY